MRQTTFAYTSSSSGSRALRRFVVQCARLDELGVRYSAGVVGLKGHFTEIEQLRSELPPRTYLWFNAFKREDEYYADSEKLWLSAIDPLFEVNATAHESRGAACRTGESVVSVDADGVIRRCHLVPTPIGNLYEAGWEDALQPRACPNDTCGCHIGHVHMNRLELYDLR